MKPKLSHCYNLNKPIHLRTHVFYDCYFSGNQENCDDASSNPRTKSRAKCNFPLHTVTITQCSVCALTDVLEIPPCVSEQIPVETRLYATDHFHSIYKIANSFSYMEIFIIQTREERGGKRCDFSD